jgi:hypothetical protein
MEGHLLDGVDWVASASGSGFVSRCTCGFETAPQPTRMDAIAEANSHVTLTFGIEPKRRFFRTRTVVDIRDDVRAAR